MPIRVIHGNGDLIGAAFQGVGEGFDKFSRQQNVDRELEDREKRTRIFDERVQSEAARMADQLRMDQEVHQAKMAEFNRQMFDIEAMRNWQRNAAQYSGPNEFAVQRQTLMDTDLPPEMKAQQMALIDMEERATMRDKAAMGYRARIGEMIRQNPEIAEQSLIAQQLADPAAMEGIAPEELPGVLHDLEQDFRLLRQQQRDDFAFAEAGQRLSKLSTDPSLGYAMQEQIPRIVEGLSDKYPPQALNNLLAGLTGEVPLSSLLDGGATEAAAREFFRSRQQEQFAQTPEGRAAIQAQAAADAGNMGLGGGGVSRGTSGAVDGQMEAPRNFADEIAARSKRIESFHSEIQDLESRLNGDAFSYRSERSKRGSLMHFRDAVAANPGVLDDEAAYTKLMESNGLDPSDPDAAAAAANAATMLTDDFTAFLSSVEGGQEKRKADRAKLKAIKDAGPSAPDLYEMVRQAAMDETGEKWRALPPGAEGFKKLFRDPTSARKVESGMDALIRSNQGGR